MQHPGSGPKMLEADFPPGRHNRGGPVENCLGSIVCASFAIDQNAILFRRLSALLMLGAVLLAGCGTTRTSDTARTATEQLLLSQAVDHVLSAMDFTPLAGTDVYVDPTYLESVDKNYVLSSVREHLFAVGARIKDKADNAEMIVEVRSGALGTDRYERFIGVPQLTLLPPPLPPAIPETPFFKRLNQQGVAKLAVYAYRRKTGELVLLGGTGQSSSNNQSLWILGLGPFEKGSIRRGRRLGGEQLPVILPDVMSQWDDELLEAEIAVDAHKRSAGPAGSSTKSAGGAPGLLSPAGGGGMKPLSID